MLMLMMQETNVKRKEKGTVSTRRGVREEDEVTGKDGGR